LIWLIGQQNKNQWLAHHLSAVIIDDITRRHDTQRNDIQHNDTQHKELICDAQHN
jgi:hypothetical protein